MTGPYYSSSTGAPRPFLPEGTDEGAGEWTNEGGMDEFGLDILTCQLA